VRTRNARTSTYQNQFSCNRTLGAASMEEVATVSSDAMVMLTTEESTASLTMELLKTHLSQGTGPR
jgi:hypothetical protein